MKHAVGHVNFAVGHIFKVVSFMVNAYIQYYDLTWLGVLPAIFWTLSSVKYLLFTTSPEFTGMKIPAWLISSKGTASSKLAVSAVAHLQWSCREEKLLGMLHENKWESAVNWS